MSNALVPWFDGLTERQRRFCEAYAANGGNAFQAAKTAGYKKPHPQGVENLQKPTITGALEKLREDQTNSAIMTREERQALWTRMARGEVEDRDGMPISAKDRLKASELLGRSQADFVDRVDATTRIIVEHVHETIDG